MQYELGHINWQDNTNNSLTHTHTHSNTTLKRTYLAFLQDVSENYFTAKKKNDENEKENEKENENENKQQFYSIRAALCVFFEAYVTYTQSAAAATYNKTIHTHTQAHTPIHSYTNLDIYYINCIIRYIYIYIYHFWALSLILLLYNFRWIFFWFYLKTILNLHTYTYIYNGVIHAHLHY